MIALALRDGRSAVEINYNSSPDNKRCRDFADKYELEFNAEQTSVVQPIVGSASELLQTIAGNHSIAEASAVTPPSNNEIELTR
jgi:hypothetical protein